MLSRILLRPRRYLIILGGALAISFALAHTALYRNLDRWIEDSVQGITARPLRFDDVLVIDIDEQSMANLEASLGAWPYPRDIYAQVVEYLRARGARVIVFDILFAEPRSGDDALAKALAGGTDVWLAGRGLEYPLQRDADYFQRLDRLSWDVRIQANAHPWADMLLPAIRSAGMKTDSAGVGIISILTDSDGVLRQFPLLHEVHGRVLPGMPLAALFTPAQVPQLRGSAIAGWVAAGDRRWPVDAAGRVHIQIPRNRDFLPVVGFDRVLLAAAGHSEAELPPGQIRGRTVFIGSSAAVLGDYAFIPIHGRIAGLGVLALFYASLAHGLVLKPAVVALDLLLIALAAALPLLYSNRRACTEIMIGLWALLGLAVALTVHVALFGWYAQRSDILFALQTGMLVLAIQLMARLKTLYDERRRLYYAKQAADEASELKSRFLAHMTHELRTPLTAIMGFNRLLAEPDLSAAERRRETDTIERNCRHLLALINNLLDQAKIEAGQMTLTPAPTAVREVAAEVHGALLAVAAEKQVALKLAIDDALPQWLELDALRLRQILYNLLGNGLKFTSQGQVLMSIGWRPGTLVIEVSDTGPGMDSQALGRIFEAFQQADDSIAPRHGGTGLGLTITRNLVELMDGRMEVESTPGEGSLFRVLVSAQVLSSGPQSDDSGPRNGEDGMSAGSSLKVLIADDSTDIRMLLSLYLKRGGIEAVLAEDGRQALDRTLAQQPDVVLMDMEMPVMDGAEATRALRAQGYQGAILAMTAHQDPQQTRVMSDAGCDGILEKPLSRQALLKVLADVEAKIQAGQHDG